ncbi:hypothetical protein [Burkholderia stagnalis]
MATKKPPASRQAKRPPQAAAPKPALPPRAPAAPALKRPVPTASLAKAATAFQSFSLSRFGRDAHPGNYVAVGQNPTTIQRTLISRHIDILKNADTPTRTMSLAFPDSLLKQLLPSFNASTGTVDLGEVMSLIQKNMRGTEFYANGDPTLNRLAIQARLQEIIDGVAQGTKK